MDYKQARRALCNLTNQKKNCSEYKTHREPNLRIPSGTKLFLLFFSATPIVSLRHGLSPARAGNQRLECSTLIHLLNSQTCLNGQSVTIGAYFFLSLGIRMVRPRLVSLLCGWLLLRGRWSASMDYCAGIVVSLNPRLGMEI